MHPKGGMQLAMDMETKYSVRQLYKMLELFEVYDALEEQKANKIKQEQKKNK